MDIIPFPASGIITASLALPPLKKLQAIADTLDRLLVESQRFEPLYQQKLAALDAMKKSLLHQAFTGTL
jgi:type I restriction enzyme S subunit